MAKQDNESMEGCLGCLSLIFIYLICIFIDWVNDNNWQTIQPIIWNVAKTIFWDVVCLVIATAIFSSVIERITKRKAAASLYLQGDNLFKNEKYDEALRCYEQAYDRDNSTADYYFYAKAMVYYAQKNYKEVLFCLNDGLSKITSGAKKEYLILIKNISEKSKNYKQALDYITEDIEIAKTNKLNTSEFSKLKNKLKKQVDNISIAERDFQSALQAYDNKNYALAIQNLEKAITLIPDNEEYQTKLQEIQDEYNKVLYQTEYFCKNAENYSKNNNFESAITEIDNALKLIKDNKYVKFKKDLETKQRQFQETQKRLQNEQKAENLYNKANRLYRSNRKNFDEIVALLNKAIRLSPKKTYENMLTKVKKENDLITAEKLYEEAKEYFNKKDYNKGLTSIKQAVKLDPSNRIYIDLKQKIDWEQKETEKREKADKNLKNGLEALQDGNFEGAIENFEELLNLEPHNSECKALLDKAKTGKIDITDCTKNALLTLDFINEEQAENIIQARKEGVMWYEYQKFAEQFGIMPHLWADVEEKIEFPLKQANKYGRRLDW